MAINLSSTTPAAPAGDQLVTFQTDGSGNVSGYIPSTPTLFTVNNIDLTAQNTSLSAANILGSPSNGTYRVSAYVIVTTVDGASSTLPSVVITWNDRDNGQAQTITLTATNTGNTLTTYKSADVVISASSSAAIQYSTTGYASGSAGVMKYALHIRIEQI